MVVLYLAGDPDFVALVQILLEVDNFRNGSCVQAMHDFFVANYEASQDPPIVNGHDDVCKALEKRGFLIRTTLAGETAVYILPYKCFWEKV